MPTLQIWLTDQEHEQLVFLKAKVPHMRLPQYAAQLIRERLEQLATAGGAQP